MDASETSFVLEGLDMNALYVFRVYAENEAGMGDALVMKNPVRVKENIREYCLIHLSFRTFMQLYLYHFPTKFQHYDVTIMIFLILIVSWF